MRYPRENWINSGLPWDIGMRTKKRLTLTLHLHFLNLLDLIFG